MTEPKTTPTAEDIFNDFIRWLRMDTYINGYLSADDQERGGPEWCNKIRHALKTAAGCSSVPDGCVIVPIKLLEAARSTAGHMLHSYHHSLPENERDFRKTPTGADGVIFKYLNTAINEAEAMIAAAPKDIDPAGEGVKNG